MNFQTFDKFQAALLAEVVAMRLPKVVHDANAGKHQPFEYDPTP